MATYNSNRPPPSIPTALNEPMDSEGLIKPQKLKNPVVESPRHRAVTRELKLNSKRGQMMQNSKSELQKAWAKKEAGPKKAPVEREMTEFDKILQSMHYSKVFIAES